MRARLHRAGPLAGARRHPARHWAPAKAAEAPFIEAAGAPSRRRPRMHSRTRSWPAARRCSKSCLRRSWRACPPATAARRSGRAASGTTATGGRAARTVCTAGARAALPLDRQAVSARRQTTGSTWTASGTAHTRCLAGARARASGTPARGWVQGVARARRHAGRSRCAGCLHWWRRGFVMVSTRHTNHTGHGCLARPDSACDLADGHLTPDRMHKSRCIAQ